METRETRSAGAVSVAGRSPQSAAKPKPASTRRLLKGILAAALGIVIASGAPANGQTVTTVNAADYAPGSAQFQAVQNAVDNFDIVNLRGVFNLPATIGAPLRITRDVTLRGEKPIGNFDLTGENLVDERDWPTKIMANNNFESAILIDNPGGTVEFDSLHIESGSDRIIHVGDIWPASLRDACKDLKVEDCKIVGTEGLPAAIGTFGGITGTVHLEANHIVGAWPAGDWALWSGFVSKSKWEVYSNALIATQVCLDIVGSQGLRMENNRCEGSSILHSPGTQGQIVVKNNTMIQSGHQSFGGANNAFVFVISHWDGFSGGEISGNTIEMNPTLGVQISWAPLMCLAHWDPAPAAAAHGLLIQDNTISGKADWAINLDNGASHNIIRRNNLEDFTAVPFGLYGACQISITRDCHDNVFRDNVMGQLGYGVTTGIYCAGDNNDFVRNDYTLSGIRGLARGSWCLTLANSYAPTSADIVAEPENNLVFESGGFPPGTTAAEQVLDEPRDLTGTTTNTVVGHRSDVLLPEDINCDGIVDFCDLARLAQNWLRQQ